MHTTVYIAKGMRSTENLQKWNSQDNNNTLYDVTFEFGIHLATIVNSPTATFCDAFQRLTIDDREVIVNCDFATMCE